MKRVILKNKPLVEAIFELRWKLKEIAPLRHVDPQYKILIGRIYDRVNKEYPYHEQLPIAFMPDEMAHHMVQHRFRKDKNDWPLIQLGPGIITLNDTDSYVWEDFEKRIIKIIDTLFQTYPNSEKELDIDSILLRYIDAVEFEYNNDDIFKFLSNQMKIGINFNEKLFEDTRVNYLPRDFNFKYSFNSNKPKGIIHLSFARGKKTVQMLLFGKQILQQHLKIFPRGKLKLCRGWMRHMIYQMIGFLKLLREIYMRGLNNEYTKCSFN